MEIMSKENMKNAATLLHEFTVKHKHPVPEYTLTISKTKTHKNEFHYKVTVASVCAVGIGRSKKLAKHDAAGKALTILAEKGLLNDEYSNRASEDPLKHPINYMGILENSCSKFSLPHAVFTEIGDAGPPHCRQFTYQCQVGSTITQSTAQAKKKAKQSAAAGMLSKIQNGELKACEEPGLKSDIIGDFIIRQYTNMNRPLKQSQRKVEIKDDFTSTLTKIMREKNLKFGDFQEHFQTRNLENLDAIFGKLGIEHKIKVFQESPPIVFSEFSLQIPFALMALGSSIEHANLNLISQIYSVLDVCMSANLADEF